MIVKTPLKWVGSKSKVMTELLKHLPVGQRLVEPFGGSCAVMMATDYPAYLVADINCDLINMYQQIQQHENAFTALAAKLFAQHASEDGYYKMRAEFNNEPWMPLLYRAAVFLYLNRHGYRGVCRYNQRGGFNVPYEKTARPIFPADEIRAFAVKAARAQFLCVDFTETLQLVKPGDVIYSDSPYDGTFSQYHTEGFNRPEQEELAVRLNGLAAMGYPVVVSNSDTDFIRKAYSTFELNHITTSRSVAAAAGDSKKGKEIIAVSGPKAGAELVTERHEMIDKYTKKYTEKNK
ncbi:Dam family site-specific DNA-(adenine-N6)-methyltransferase [Erwinia sp. E602]|uniref:DNA adenine methylase n=1 Tax=Erwinia sp. E602 TaxID=2675378 RepID=UPI001BAE2039|nr:Dam family site-specific DNA-(adenine-N6)-methyltransferase [Erwinia sp. E602]QUG76359.1 Dam family site-specific DNA-(adenine-N6)-methyltransferase [Erwinia sp. E602]